MSQANHSESQVSPPSAPPNLTVIAYNSADREHVADIYDELKNRGVTTWVDFIEQRPGTDWSVGFDEAMKKATVVVVFCSSHGVGPWQAQEFRVIHSECVERGVHVVPVELLGGNVPDDPLFKRLQKVTFRHSQDEDALNKLLFGITGVRSHPTGHFNLVAEVNGVEAEFATPSCFLAVSHATSREIYEIMMDAAEDAGLQVRQPREFVPEDVDAFAPDVAVAVRKATVILADGTPQSETEKPDADVMYEVGLAEAFAKPVVFVTTPKTKPIPLQVFVCDGSCSLVEYDPDEVNYAGPLREQVTKQLLRNVEKSRPPHLVPDNNIGVSVAYSNVFHHRAVFWQPFERIMQYGLKVKRIFADVLKHLYGLKQIVEVAQDELMAGNQANSVTSPLRRFRDAFSGFCVTDYAGRESVTELRDESNSVYEALMTLRSSTAGDSDDVLSLQQIVESSIQYHEILNVYLDQYIDALEALVNYVKAPSDHLPRHVIRLHGEVRQLVVNAELVPVHACEMMVQILCLVGLQKNNGEKSHD